MLANETTMDSSHTSSLSIISQPRLSPSFHIADILGLNQATPVTLPSSHPSSSDQQCPPRHRRRRTRTIYTREQLQSMEAVFASNQYPGVNLRDALANAIDLTEARVQVWFHNRRTRRRRPGKRQVDKDRVVSCNTISSESSSRPPSTISSRASTPSSCEASSPPRLCSCRECNVASPPTVTSRSNNLSDCNIPTVPSPPSSSPCDQTCCSTASIYSAYPSPYTRTPQYNNVSTIPYGRIPPPAANSYSSLPTHYAYPSSAAYYYHPTALNSAPYIYHRPTVFNFQPVVNARPAVEIV